jgi:hypothetical protein
VLVSKAFEQMIDDWTSVLSSNVHPCKVL